MGFRMVVYHDRFLDLHLNVQVYITILAAEHVGPNTAGDDTTGVAENELALSANLGSL